MVNVNSNLELHGDHVKWNNELSLYQDSLKTFENRLSEISEDFNDIEALKKIEHFQNQFIIQNDAISKLKNQIQKHEINLTITEKEGSDDRISEDDKNYHGLIAENMDRHRILFNELKEEFYSFITKLV